MTKQELRECLLAGFEYVIHLPGVGNMTLTTEEATEFVNDPVAWALDYLEGTFEEYNEFLDDMGNGGTQCRTITGKGTQCQNPSAESYYDFDKWQEHHNAGWVPTCNLHLKKGTHHV